MLGARRGVRKVVTGRTLREHEVAIRDHRAQWV